MKCGGGACKVFRCVKCEGGGVGNIVVGREKCGSGGV